MGALMSKKQQVQKVQKCSLVISAFKEGIKEREFTPSQSENEPVPADQPTETTDGALPTGKEEEEKEERHQEEENKQIVTSQLLSNAQKEIDCKVNQEAWARLRDGKGVEPEDINKINPLIPPTFVRPKRDINDDQPVNIELQLTEKPFQAEMCEICEVWTADELYPCRICTRVFHDGCLREMGYLHKEALQLMRDTAHTETGWSCYHCDNVNLLLTEEEMYSLIEIFKQCRIIPETCLVSNELLQYKQFLSRQLMDKDLTDEQEEEVLALFSALDPDRKGQIEWTDFLYHESLGLLNKFRSQNSLVRLLTAKERDRARAVFLSLDQDKDGWVLSGEMQKAQVLWFHKHNKDYKSCGTRFMGLCANMPSMSNAGPIMENWSPFCGSREKAAASCRKNDKKTNWQEFLKESAIYILGARPNSDALHFPLPL